MISPSESVAFGPHRYAPGEVIAGKYRLDQALGEGGMGTVWQAFNLQLEAPVALKLIRAGLDRDLLTVRLKQEARAAAKLGHPAIVRVFDVGESEFGDPFIVMELLTGQSLGSLLSGERRLGALRTLQLLLPVADALSAAHAKGIVHRDLKPDNVFIALEGERVQPKLVDFGIVKVSDRPQTDAHLTQAGTVLGSPEYMSPEQARGREDIDQRTDIWSFAVVLYECLAGKTPFSGKSYNALLRSIVEDEPRSLLDHLACDKPLWEIIRRGLAKDVSKRFSTMNEFGRQLATWLLAQGVFEDSAGGSLEAKWLASNSDPFSARASRASFASLTSQVPESGVRPLRGALGSAVTIGLPTLPVPGDPSGGVHALLGRRTLAVLGVLLLLVTAAYSLVLQRAATEPPLVQPAPTVARAEPRSAVAVTPAPSPPAAPASAATAASSGRSSAPSSRSTGQAPLVRPPLTSGSAPQKTRQTNPGQSSSDLLAPY